MKLSDYHKDDYQGMLVNPLSIKTSKDVASSAIGKHKEFDLSMDHIENIVVYIALVYDRKSPLYKIDDMDKRKSSAAVMAGFHYNGEFDPHVVRMIRCKVPKINLMILRYCRMLNNRKYALFVAGTESFHTTLNEIMNYVPSDEGDILRDNKTKLELFEKAKQNAELLDQLGYEILAMDKAKEINDGLNLMVDVIGNNDVPLSVEDFVKIWDSQSKKDITESK